MDRLFEIASGHSFQSRSQVDEVRDVGRELDDLRHLAVGVENGVVGGLKESLLAPFADAPETVGNKFPGVQLPPECLIVR